MIGKTIAELTPGDRAEITREVAQDDIAAFLCRRSAAAAEAHRRKPKPFS